MDSRANLQCKMAFSVASPAGDWGGGARPPVILIINFEMFLSLKRKVWEMGYDYCLRSNRQKNQHCVRLRISINLPENAEAF